MLFFIALFNVLQANAVDWSTLGGKVELRAGEFLTTTDDYPHNMGQGILKLEISASHENLGLKVSPVLTTNIQDLSETKIANNHLLSSELWGDFTSDKIDFIVGMAPVKWGAADGLNPTNGFRSFDLSDPVFPRELSQTQVSVRLHPGADQDIVFEGIYVPHGQTDLLPFGGTGKIDPMDSRWGTVLPTAVDVNQGATVPLKYTLESEHHNSSQDFAGRIRLLQVKGWDYSLALGQFRRKRSILSYRLTGDANDPALPLTVRIKPFYPRQTMIGGDAAGTWNEYGLRFEAAQYMVKKSDRAFGYNSFIASSGIDRLWENILWDGSLYVNAVYIYVNNDKSSVFVKDSIDLAFTRSYGTLRTEFRLEKWTTGADFLVTEDRSSVVNFFLRHEWSEALNLSLTASLLNGNVNSGIGRLSENHRLIGQLEYFF
ncbi:MAG: hypothetical protein LW878_06995 [Proteobacteria bacterium]|nr:hypothetical protein [Pseudomonadota bacterium]